MGGAKKVVWKFDDEEEERTNDGDVIILMTRIW